MACCRLLTVTCRRSPLYFKTDLWRVKGLPLISSVRNNTQHRVLLLPEIPPDTPETNPILKRYNDNLPDFAKVTERHCYMGLGKALLEYESAVAQMEGRCEDGETDFEKLFTPLEIVRCQFESVWNSANLLHLTTDFLDRDKYAILHARAERAFLSKFGSRPIYETMKQLKSKHLEEGGKFLTHEQERIVDMNLLEGKHQGLALPEDKRMELTANWMKRIIDSQREYDFNIKTLTERYRHHIRNPLVVQDFPVDVLKAMAADSAQPTKGPWTVTLHPYIYKQVMAYCPDRDLRRSVYDAFVSRGAKRGGYHFNVAANVRDLRQYRLDQALTLGYKNYAELAMTTKMAETVENVHTMIASLLGKAKDGQEQELEEIQSYANFGGFEGNIEVFDVDFFRRKQRRTILGMTDDDLRDFFPLPKVLRGLFKICETMFGVKFEEAKDQDFVSKRWNPDVSFYTVTDVSKSAGNRVLGHLFFDPYMRDDKGYSGPDKGWYVPIRPHSRIAGCVPLGALVMSLPEANFGKPSLLSHSEVKELFRNFGSLLIHMCSNVPSWADVCGKTGLEWDALEVAGHFMTHWLELPEILESISGHWSTDEPLKQELLYNLCSLPQHHLAGYDLCNELFKAAYDIAFYTEDYEVESFQKISSRLRKHYLLLPPSEDDEFPLYMSEMMQGDLISAIYSSTWSRMLAADAFSAIHEEMQAGDGSLTLGDGARKVSMRFRNTFLANGSSKPMSETFRSFRGRDPSHEALLLSLGLTSASTSKQKGNAGGSS